MKINKEECRAAIEHQETIKYILIAAGMVIATKKAADVLEFLQAVLNTLHEEPSQLNLSEEKE